MPNQPETKLQQDCFVWFNNQYPELRKTMWHVQNEGKRNRYEQSIIKSLGVVPGVADLNWLYKGQFYAIELKTPTGSQAPSQKQWQRVITEQGGIYTVVRSLDEFREFVEGVVGTD